MSNYDAEDEESRNLLVKEERFSYQHGENHAPTVHFGSSPRHRHHVAYTVGHAAHAAANVENDIEKGSAHDDKKLEIPVSATGEVITTSEGDLEEIKQIDLQFNNVDLSTIDEDSIKPKKDIFEEIFQFYNKLLVLLKQAVPANSQYISRFSDCYSKLLGVVRNRLRHRQRESLAVQHLLSEHLIMQSKSFLYKQYTKEIVAFCKSSGAEPGTPSALMNALNSNRVSGEGVMQEDPVPTSTSNDLENYFLKPQSMLFKEPQMKRRNSIEWLASVVPQQQQQQAEEVTDIKHDEVPIVHTEEEEEDDQEIENLIGKRNAAEGGSWKKKVAKFFHTIFPWLRQIPVYFQKKTIMVNLRNDIVAGLTVASMLVPQAMAYGILADLPPIYGLYASFVPLLMYPLFGSCPQLQVGPSALNALMLSASVLKMRPLNDEEKIKWAIVFSFFSGLIQLLLGMLRLGFIVNLLSHPVISGFTSAAAVLIFTSQMKNILGVSHPESNYFPNLIIYLVKQVGNTSWRTLLFGIGLMIILFTLKYGFVKIRGRKISFSLVPAPLFVVLLSTGIVYLIKISGGDNKIVDDGHGNLVIDTIKIVGPITSGNPLIPHVPSFSVIRSLEDFQNVILACLPIIFVGFLETISIAKYAANIHQYEIDPNQEMLAVGFGCFVSSFFRAHPTNGCFSRTAVNLACGARSQLSSIIVAIVILITMLFLTPLFYYLPKCALSSIIMVSLVSLIDFKTLIFTYRTKGKDFLVVLVAFVATLSIGIQEGIVISVSASLLLVLFRSSRPRFVVMGRNPGTTNYSSLNWKANKHLIQIPGIIIARLDSDLFFANVSYFKEKIHEFLEHSKYEPHVFILDCGSINQIDSSGIQELKNVAENLKNKHIEFCLAQVKENVMKVLVWGDIYSKIHRGHFYHSVHDAVLETKKHMARKILHIRQTNIHPQKIMMNIQDSHAEDEHPVQQIPYYQAAAL